MGRILISHAYAISKFIFRINYRLQQRHHLDIFALVAAVSAAYKVRESSFITTKRSGLRPFD